MAKKKKSKGKDARGYSQGSVSTNAKSNKAPPVSQKTHTDMKELLHQFDNNDNNNAINSHTPQTAAVTSSVSNNTSQVVASDRFTSRLTNIITTLDALQFTQSHIEQVVQALQYDITIESALDYLCLNIPTIELPALFTDAELKQSLSEVQSGVDSLLVVRNDKSSSTEGSSAKGGEDTISQSDNILVVDSNQISKDTSDCNVQQKTDITAKDKEEDKLEKQRKEEHKNWLLQQYEYEEENEVDDSEGVDTAAVHTNKTDNMSSHQIIEEDDKPDTQQLSPEEQQLATAEATLNELQADLNNDANNYMRSKVEIKQLANQVKKMKQKVNGLKKKVERSKALQRQLIEEKVGDETEKKNSAAVIDKTAVVDEEEEEGPPLFDMFAKADDEEDDAEEKDTTTTATEDKEPNQPTKSLDFTIPVTWTGAIPTKKLDEVLKKQKLPRAKYTKLPMNSGYTLSVTLDKSKKSPTVQLWEGKNVDFIKGSSIKDYLALHALYKLDSSIPLYQMFPPVFRNLWLSWVNEEKAEKDDAQKAEDEAQKERIDGLLSLIANMHVSDSRKSSEGTVPKASVQDDAVEDREDNHDAILDNWDDDDDTTTNNLPIPIPKQYSSKGKKMQADFIKRQSTPSYQKMKATRDSLPMSSYRSNVLETMENNPVTILCAETGAGKSTQAAQYIVEQAILDGQGDNVNIICTQPRRVAATSLAERVADEMCDQLGKLVGYQIRMESKRSAQTRLMFCTTGVILRRLQDDQNLTGITHVIVDEVHERQQQIDVLLIILRQLLQTTRPDLKVILMSATMETELFTNFFNGAPLISVPGRTFPVSNYYLEDLLDATDHVIEEGSRYAIRENHYGETASLMISTRGGEKRKERVDLTSQVEAIGVSDAYAGYKMTTRRSMERVNEEIINYDLIDDVLKLVTSNKACDTLVAPDGADMSSGSILIFLPGIGEIRSLIERLEGSRLFRDRQKFDLIPLHSTLSSKDQRRAFLPSKPGCRKIICATNIAETSVTIPDVVCVLDTGRVREVRRNQRTSSSMLVTDWVPRSSSKQRQGRAGRVQSGICK